MTKRILALILLCVCLTSLFAIPAAAATPLQPDRQASLTLLYQKEGTVFPQLPVGIYRVAEALSDGSFRPVAPFASYPISIHGITSQAQWNTQAQTLWSCIVANGVQPDREVITDASGSAIFSDLDTGLYFVRQAVAQHPEGTYIFHHFFVYLPTPQPDGTWQYDVQANPKCTDFVPRSQYTVTKLWEDGGAATRPQAVTVEIYQNGVLHTTQQLHSGNNWSYTWSVSGEDTGSWTVAEKDVPQGYTVTLLQTGNSFSLVNTRQTQPEIPKTGDSFSPLPWILTVCLCGIVLLSLGIFGRRKG